MNREQFYKCYIKKNFTQIYKYVMFELELNISSY